MRLSRGQERLVMEIEVESLDRCPVCELKRLHAIASIPDFETATGDYGLVECSSCGLGFTSPRPRESELSKLYADRTTADFPDARSSMVRRLRDFATDAYLNRELRSIGKSKALEILDFGCGDGSLALGLHRYAQKQGAIVRTTAVDFHAEAPSALAQVDRREIQYVSQATWFANDERYDCIFLRHVLEHHPNPRRLLDTLRSKLRSGGRIVIEVPNRRSVWATVFGRYYSGYYMPRHLMHFDRGSLCCAVERSGLRCENISLGHTPLLGRSLAYFTGWNIGNLGLLGLASYPIQVAVDMLVRSSSTLRVTAIADA